MKKILFVLVTTVMSLVSCSDQQFVNDLSKNKVELSSVNEFDALVEKARWGDGEAYLKLADCYRDGKGVEKDFVGMICMLVQANEYGGIRRMEDYLEVMPEGTDFRMIFEAVEKFEDDQVEEAKMMSEQLVSKGVPEGYFLQGFMAMESGDTLTGLRMMEQAASQGSNLGKLMLCAPTFRGGKKTDIVKLKEMAEEMPIINVLLAKYYLGDNDDNIYDAQMAAHYFLKADEHACLDRRDVRWLLGYHETGKLQLSERDVTRLKTLTGETQEYKSTQTEEVVDTVVIIGD